MSIGGRGLQVSAILKMIQAITATRRMFICVDALDECLPEHRMVVLESLGQILKGCPSARIFMTGRPHVRSEVQRELGRAATFVFIQATEDGVHRFLREKLRKDTIPNMMSSTLEENIMKSIPAISSETYVQRVQGQSDPKSMADIFGPRFLLASLHIEAILRGATVARRRKTLKSIKDGAGLGDVCSATLERIEAQDQEKATFAIATLTWVCHSERPLQVDELCHALAVEVGEPDFDPENVPSIGTLLDYCQGLITVDAEASTVRLIHYTVQEYLCSHPGLFSKPHSILAETCLTYVNSQQIKNITPHSSPSPQSMPFLKYCARYWGTHMNKDLSDNAKTIALDLLNKYEDHISAISLLEQVPYSGYIGTMATSSLFSALHCASFFGVVELVTILINGGDYNVNQQDCTGSTPLGWAARNGHGEVVKLLLELENVDPNRADKSNQTPLRWSAVEGHERVVRLLLERDNVDPNRLDQNDRTALGCAAIEGHEGVVKLLLERENVDPNRPDKDGNGPLGCAAINGHAGLVKILLERPDVDPNQPDKDGDGPLGCAAINGHAGLVKILLERPDVDPNQPNKDGDGPLGCAAIVGHEGVVKILLERPDVDPNQPDKNGNGPLGCAAINGHEGVVRILLERQDIDPNRPNNNDRTPLGCAAVKGHEAVVKLLLERENVDPNRPDKDGNGPLGCAATNGHEGVVKILLERPDVDPNQPNKNGDGPLGCAAINGHEGVVKILLERPDIDLNRPNKNGKTPVECAARKGHEGVVKLLQQPGAIDPNRPAQPNVTPPSEAAIEGH